MPAGSRIYQRTLIAAALLLGFSGKAPGGEIRVLLADDLRQAQVRAAQGMRVQGAPAGSVLRTWNGASSSVRGSLRLVPVRGSLSFQGTAYRGDLVIRKKANGALSVINALDIEDYLQGVVAAEIPPDWEMEALKAQAVAARTYALRQKGVNAARGFSVYASVNSQMYLGKQGERPRAARAVRETAGQVLRHRGRLIDAFYHSSCGGHTGDALELWGLDAPYLRGVDCDCQKISAYGRWEKRFPVREVLAALQREGYPARDILGAANGGVTSAGQVQRVLFRTSEGTVSVPSESLRQGLGPSRLLSIFFDTELIDQDLVLSGRGRGHGVGLCQWGAQEMALRGASYRDILARYYPGTTIGAYAGK